MKKIFPLAILVLLSSFAHGQNIAANSIDLVPKTVGTLPPAASNVHRIFLVIDGVSGGDCTVGGGAYLSLCRAASGVYTAVAGPTGSGGGPGTGTQYFFPYWATTTTLGSVGSTITGQVPLMQHGAAPIVTSPGIADSTASPVSTTPYTIQCDSATTIIDRTASLRFQSGASAITVPLSSASGCQNLVTSVMDETGTLTFSRTSPDTFSVYNGATATIGATSFILSNGQFATLSQAASGIWEVRITSSGGTVSTFSVVSANGVSASVANPTTAPAATFTLGAITPSSIVDSGAFTVNGLATINPTGSALSILPSNATLISSNSGASSRIANLSFGGQAFFSGVAFLGTASAPTAVTADTQIGGFNAFAYNGTALNGPIAAFRVYANQTQTTGTGSTYADIATTPNGSTTEAEVIRFNQDGGITVPSTVTGGDEGPGTINAEGLYVNGVAVGFGSGTVSSGTADCFAWYTGATTVGSDCNLDDGNTTAGTITSQEPIAIAGSTHGVSIPAGTAFAGASATVIYASDSTNGYAEVNENNTGLSRLCTAANSICVSSAGGTLTSGVGLWGTSAINTVLASTVANVAGHFTNLQVVTALGGTCTTVPKFNVFDGTSNVGSTVTASASTQTKGTGTSTAQTQTFASGDVIGIFISTAGATCTTDQFTVTAQYSIP